MRKEPLLTAVPPVPVQSLSELYAIAFDLAQKAAQRYGGLATQMDERFWPVRSVFEVLATRERDRADRLSAACLADCGRRPDIADLRWTPIDLVPDFIPVLGYADDAIVVALVLRSVVRRAGTDAVVRHWPGTPEGLTSLQRLTGALG